MKASLLKRLEALENRPKGSIEIFIYEDGHRERGNLYRVMKVMVKEGSEYFKRKPHDRIVDCLLPYDEDGIYSAIFRATLQSIQEGKECLVFKQDEGVSVIIDDIPE